MQKNIFITVSLALLFCGTLVSAGPSSGEKEFLSQVIKCAIRDLVEDNEIFAELTPPQHFAEFQDIQNPRVTMVMCSDSRVQVDNFSQGAENDIFVARNIGNQFITTKGSIEYGVDVLKTPVLLIVGHSNCGAIKAARENISHIKQPAIRKELETLDVKAAPDNKQGVVLNVHHQVEAAMADFKEKVKAGQLAIIGAVYDFRNDYGYGKGQLIIVNLNGIKDPEEIRKSKYFNDIKTVSIGIPNEKPKKAAGS
jgi:carbonic anhydrase